MFQLRQVGRRSAPPVIPRSAATRDPC